MTRKERLRKLTELIIFAMLGVIMFISKILMEALPNIHLIGMLTMVCTIVYRKKALIPIYVYVFLNGFYSGFSPWWVPYLYIWTILWGVTMLLPKNMKPKVAVPVYAITCGLHGLLFGTLYAPAQALMYGLNFDAMIAWIIAGLPFDAMHSIGDFAAGLFIVPVATALKSFDKKAGRGY